MRTREKNYTIGDYWIELSLSTQNPILDFWVCRDRHVCVGDEFPFWHFRVSILKFKISVNPSIF